MAKKLGIADGMRVAALHAPDELGQWLAPLPEGATVTHRLPRQADVLLAFVTERAHLIRAWPKLTAAAGDTGAVWVCWPKKASKVPTDMTENVVRDVALPTGWVDVKVCAASAGKNCEARDRHVMGSRRDSRLRRWAGAVRR